MDPCSLDDKKEKEKKGLHTYVHIPSHKRTRQDDFDTLKSQSQ